MDSVHGDGVRYARACERRAASAECGGGTPDVDRSAGDGPGAQPAILLRHYLHQSSRVWLHRADEPLYARAVLSLRGGTSQLRSQRDLAGGHIHRHLRGAPRDPCELGPLDPLVPRGAAHRRTSETRVRRAMRAGDLTFPVRDSRRELYPLCTMTSNNTEWERGDSTSATKAPASPLHWHGVEGEDQHLASWCVSSLAPGAAGVAH
jgi:hypothetical protein